MNCFEHFMTPCERVEGRELSCTQNGARGTNACESAVYEREGCACPVDCPSVPESRFGLQCCRETFPLAMTYIPSQQFDNLYDCPMDGLSRGTIFKELDFPFFGGKKGGCCS